MEANSVHYLIWFSDTCVFIFVSNLLCVYILPGLCCMRSVLATHYLILRGWKCHLGYGGLLLIVL